MFYMFSVGLTPCHSAAAQGAPGYTERPPRPKGVKERRPDTNFTSERKPTQSLPAAMACWAAHKMNSQNFSYLHKEPFKPIHVFRGHVRSVQ